MAVCKQPPLPADSNAEELDETTRENRWKKFHPFRVVRKIFRKRMKREPDASKKSWSTSELQSVQDDAGKSNVSSVLKSGFSVSHDSIFSPEGNINAISGEPLSISAGSSLTIHQSSMHNMFKDELFSTVHLRRDLDDGDYSSTSPTLTEHADVYTDFKETSQAISSSYSLSRIETSENFEATSASSSKKISRTSFLDRLPIKPDVPHLSQSAPLNHKAALHKIAIRPKRTHGLPHRKKKQITAAKEDGSPSISDVKEELYKSSNLVEAKALAEFPSSEKSHSSHSSEWQMSLHSCKEELNLVGEVLLEKEKCVSFTHIAKESFNDEINKRIGDKDLMMEEPSSLSHIKNEDIVQTKSKYSDAFVNNSNDIGTDSSITIIDDVSINVGTSLKETILSSQEENVSALKITSVIQNIETSDVSKRSERIHSFKKEKCATDKRLDNELNLAFHKNNLSGKTKNKANDDFLSQSCLKGTSESLSLNNSNTDILEGQKEISTSNSSDIDCVLKPLRKPSFEDEKTLTPLFLEKDSTSTISVNKSEIYVSHHSSTEPGLINVTEARNYTTVEVLNNATGDSCAPWISSVDDLATKNLDTESMVYSSTSNVSDNKLNNSIITISVNSKSDKGKSALQKHEKLEKPSVTDQKVTNFSKPKVQQPTSKEKPTTKYTSQDLDSSNVCTKNATSQKRVSVEIVPFSQRMKERKYQPISFANKDSPEQSKRSTTVIEKKVSAQKATFNKELGKANKNISPKSSFSDSNKGDSTIERKNVKADKLQCPVQIRIQKSKPTVDNKDKNLPTVNVKKDFGHFKEKGTLVEVASKSQVDKVNQNDIPPSKVEKKVQENVAKWETQHSSLDSNTSILSNDNLNKIQPETDCVNKPETEKKDETELPDNNCKPPSFSDDPEPELLRVFARRSIKQKHSDKEKAPEHKDRKAEDNDGTALTNKTVMLTPETSKPHITKHELKKKSKSFCEKTTRAVSPLKEMNLGPGEAPAKLLAESSPETTHPRQRLASVSDTPSPQCTPPPSKEVLLGVKAQPPWVQLAQQRKELREQRERLLLGGASNSFMDPSNKPSRSSKVWDMVNNFQKLQMT